jgi:hypothetical protein
MSQRDEWKFDYTVKAVLEGARGKLTFHLGRHEFWEKKKAETLQRIKAGGIDVQESLAGANYSNVARGFEAQIVVDPTLQRDLDECANKIREHDTKARKYSCWVEVLLAQPAESRLELDHDDHLFFFGK